MPSNADGKATAAESFRVSQRRLINIDEAGFERSRVIRKYGHSITTARI